MRAILSIFLIVLVATMTSCSLLEMSQTLWTKALQGGLTKIGALDPLRIPIVKVDQSEGNTTYRMILRSVEIRGLNSSTLESIHLGRGRLKSNLSEHEAGYVSYTDQHDIDMIRYRFHTVIKEPKVKESQNLEVESIPGLEKSSVDNNSQRRFSNSQFASANRGNYQTSSRYRDNQEQEFPQGQRMHQERTPSRHENDRSRPHVHTSNYEVPNRRHEGTRYPGGSANVETPLRPETSDSYTATRNYQLNSQHPVNARHPSERVRVVYAERFKNPENNYETITRRSTTQSSATSGCPGNCEYKKNSYNLRTNHNQQRDDLKSRQEGETGTAAATNFESRGAHNTRVSALNNDDDCRGQIRITQSENENRYANTFDAKTGQPNNYPRNQQQSRQSSTSQRLKNQPGYVDIVYADEKDHKMRHFGNLRVQPGSDMKVYSLDDVLRDLSDHKRFIIHNFTEGESLMKKNDAVRTASESKRIEDLVRYAKDFQEKNGYYEEGMQLIYHYGGKEGDLIVRDSEGRRTKRAHLDEENDDDVMHVIMKIRVPMLRVDAGYVLTGTVGKQVLRGNGLLSANFTELIGDFTLELKKVDDDTMIVRAARARLSANGKKITLQGMDEEGPVNEILTQGLMAAEAVAAMLADDLTTKALSEKTADSIIYRMYKNLPSEN